VQGLQAQQAYLRLTQVEGLPPTPTLECDADNALGASLAASNSHESLFVDASAARLVKSGESLEEIRADLGDCQRCRLHQKRSKIVFGQGDAHAALVFVGEGPGQEEDLQGLAFVGKAGELLGKMIGAMGYTREQVYICNIVKCRPPQNRDPEVDEIAMCEPYLQRQLAALNPRVIVALGRISAQALLQVSTPISKLRGQWGTYQGVAVMPTFHPAYLLRNPQAKRSVWTDLQEVMQMLNKHGA
jgi:DNA polymerase